MLYTYLLHHLLQGPALKTPDAPALGWQDQTLSYHALQAAVSGFARALRQRGLSRGERVAVFLDKRPEHVVACFGSSMAGMTFVPINPLLKAEQVLHILYDCQASLLVTDDTRLAQLRAHPAARLPALLICGQDWPAPDQGYTPPYALTADDNAAIFYTSGSTGRPKGVLLSHQNLVVGALSVASYLGHTHTDRLLAVLPLSFDAGFSQITTAFAAGAHVQLLNYLLPRDVPKAMAKAGITGLTAVPPLWIQLSRLEWPPEASRHLRYFANTGGHLPRPVLTALRERAPAARPFLMYGLTEAFRASFLDPEQIDQRIDSIGQAIPNTELLVLREDGTPCEPGETGELVQRGPLVAKGYWNDPQRTAERFRPLPPGLLESCTGRSSTELAVFSGDSVRRDEDGFLYFVGRRDEMIKTSGYRVSPTEIEDIAYHSGMVAEAVASGEPHAELGQSILLVIWPQDLNYSNEALLACFRKEAPAYMQPTRILIARKALPRNPNGKLDRPAIALAIRAGEFDASS